MICANTKCGKEFVPHIRNPHQKYCSKKCKKKAEYIRDKEKINKRNKDNYHKKHGKFLKLNDFQKIRICNCGNEFEIDMITIRQKYCSLKCQRRYIGASRRKKPNNIKQNALRYALKQSKDLTDGYIRIIISQRKDINKFDIPKEMVEQKRLALKITRKIKQIENENSR